jgi:hypothetical protein
MGKFSNAEFSWSPPHLAGKYPLLECQNRGSGAEDNPKLLADPVWR